MLILLSPNTIFIRPSSGLDSSWAISVHLALMRQFIHGRDYVFTYGPLGFLATRYPIAISKWQLLIWDAFLLITVAFILLYVMKQLDRPIGIFLAFLVVLSSSWYLYKYTMYMPTFLFAVLLFLVFYYLRHEAWWALLLVFLIGLAMFFVKMNTGLLALATVLILLAFLYGTRRKSRKSIAGFGLVLLLGLLASSILLRVDLIGYVRAGMHLAGSYNDAMYLVDSDGALHAEYLAMAVTLIAAFGAIVMVRFRYLWLNKDSLFRFLLVGLFMFVAFKHSFVRADNSHIASFFYVIPMGIGLLYLFEEPPLRRPVSALLVISLILALPFSIQFYSVDHIVSKFDNFRGYLQQVTRREAELMQFSMPDKSRLPDPILGVVDDHSLDVIPWEISYILANDLAQSYNPRPVVQSYVASDQYLDGLNRDKYLSDTSPDFILFSMGDIDNRHPFFTESETKLAILTNYEVVLRADDLILLRHRAESHSSIEVGSTAGNAMMEEFIDLAETDELLYLTADVQYSLLGKLARIFFRPPPLLVTLEFEDGEQQTYRAVKTMVNGKVLANKFVDSTDAALMFFSSRGQLAERVTRLRFHTPAGWGFQREFDYEITKTVLEEGQDQPLDVPAALTPQLTLTAVDPKLVDGFLMATLRWEGSSEVGIPGRNQRYTAYVHLLDDQGRRLAGHDVLLDEVVSETVAHDLDGKPVMLSFHEMEIPPDLPSGPYDLRIGIYYFDSDQLKDTNSVFLADRVSVVDDSAD